MAADTLSIYDDLMRFKPAGLTPNGWAVLAGVSRTVWTDMKRHGNPSRRTLEKLLQAAGSSLAEFEALRISGIPASEGLPAGGLADRRPGWGPPEVSPLSLLKTSVAGEWRPGSKIELMEIYPTEVLAHLPRPLSLANDLRAYAMTIVGDSMWPRFRPGRCVAVADPAGERLPAPFCEHGGVAFHRRRGQRLQHAAEIADADALVEEAPQDVGEEGQWHLLQHRAHERGASALERVEEQLHVLETQQ